MMMSFEGQSRHYHIREGIPTSERAAELEVASWGQTVGNLLTSSIPVVGVAEHALSIFVPNTRTFLLTSATMGKGLWGTIEPRRTNNAQSVFFCFSRRPGGTLQLLSCGAQSICPQVGQSLARLPRYASAHGELGVWAPGGDLSMMAHDALCFCF